ncbi:PREDICTED: retinoic acid receptor responder protein 1 [Haliaeetus leucocephalus]|uniref:retinoic acid receptor responder protein 1 n=1 Tax=Haliaeetus leucocephalus TaxID=52644 RepID=UPI00053CE672|nr:PREDICTED: retinoic acid receptor responder protein 1 [Haliaeetus leucocephalus]
MQGLSSAPPAAFLLLLLRLSSLLLLPVAAVPVAERELNPSSRLAAGAARVALHYLNFQTASPGELQALGQVRKATVKSIPDSGHKYYVQFTTEDYRSGVSLWSSASLLTLCQENAGSCLATVLYRKTKSPPLVNIKCMPTKDQKQIQEEDNRLYQKIRHQTKPIIGNNIPDSYGNIEPALEPVWALAVAGSSYIMWEKSTENLGYFMAQVKSVKQWIRKDDFIEFDYTVLLHEIPTQEIISCHMRLTWLPGHPLKVKYFCASENQGLEDGSGMESGSAAGILHERGANF